MTAVHGRNINLYQYKTINSVLAPVLIACGVSVSIVVEAEEIAITTADSGRNEEYEGGLRTASIDFSGLITLDELTKAQFEDEIELVGTKARYILTLTNDFGDKLAYDFNALVRSVTGSGDVNDFGSFDMSLRRSGSMNKLKTYDNVLVDTNGDLILDAQGNLIRVP